MPNGPAIAASASNTQAAATTIASFFTNLLQLEAFISARSVGGKCCARIILSAHGQFYLDARFLSIEWARQKRTKR
jgi:hypothetical protein